MQNKGTKITLPLRLALISSALMLGGCAGTGAFWSSLSPMNWFGHSLEITPQGVGEVTSSSPMIQSTISEQLDNKYRLRSGMQTSKGQILAVYQGMNGEQVKIDVIGPEGGNVSTIIVSDSQVKTSWGTQIGDAFSTIYQQAYGVCEQGEMINQQPTIECQAPQSKNISYRFTGKWQGPEGLMPSDDVLQHWKINQIIWRK